MSTILCLKKNKQKMGSDIFLIARYALFNTFILYVSLFLFPMMHDLAHLGLQKLILDYTSIAPVAAPTIISLGRPECSQQLSIYTLSSYICINQEWLYTSLFRSSALETTGLARIPLGVTALGGLLGFSFCFLFSTIFSLFIWRLSFREGWGKSLRAAFSILICPLQRLERVLIPASTKWIVGVCAVAIQIDTINGIIYSYLPSRRLDFSEQPMADGMVLWNKLDIHNSLFTQQVINTMAIVISALLYLFYFLALVRLAVFAVKCKRENRLIRMRVDEERQIENRVAKTKLAQSFNPSATVMALYAGRK